MQLLRAELRGAKPAGMRVCRCCDGGRTAAAKTLQHEDPPNRAPCHTLRDRSDLEIDRAMASVNDSRQNELGHDFAAPLMCPTAGLRTTHLARAKKLPLRVLVRSPDPRMSSRNQDTTGPTGTVEGQHTRYTRGTLGDKTGTLGNEKSRFQRNRLFVSY